MRWFFTLLLLITSNVFAITPKLDKTKKELKELTFTAKKPETKQNKRQKFSMPILNIPRFLVYLIAVLILVFILIFILKQLSINSTNARVNANDWKEVDSIPESKTLMSLDLEKLIEKETDLRNLIRLYFLLCLQQLLKAKLIYTEPSLTNNAYISMLNEKPFMSKFKKLTQKYELAWFSHLHIAEDTLNEVKQLQEEIKNEIE